MRLFVYNHGKLKYFFTEVYSDQKTLSDVFKAKITAAFDLDNNPRKKTLWGPALETLSKVVFVKSASYFKSNQPAVKAEQKPPYPVANSIYDFYLDRGTGWCALAKNYSIIQELDKTGNIPNKLNAFQLNATLPWNTYNDAFYVRDTNKTGTFISNLTTGKTSIIPYGVGSFYSDSKTLSLDVFTKLMHITKKISNTVRAVVSVEWPAIAFNDPLNIQSNPQGVVVQDYNDSLQLLLKEGGNLGTKNGDTYKTNNTTLPLFNHSGAKEYIKKLKEVESLLVVTYRQMHAMILSSNFDTSELNTTFLQKLVILSLYIVEQSLVVMGSVVGGLPAETASVGTKFAAGSGKVLFTEIGDYVAQKRQQYATGNSEVSVSSSFQSMSDALMISYSAYELFLLKWGIGELITTRKPADIERKLVKVTELIKAKNNSASLPKVDLLKDEVNSYLSEKEEAIETRLSEQVANEVYELLLKKLKAQQPEL